MAAQPLVSQPAFNLSYDIKPVDIGSGYAKGIASAGESIAGAISNVMNVADQNRTANDMLTQLSQMKDPQGNPILSKEDYESIMKKGLGAKHELAGELFGRFHSQYQSMLDQQRQVAVAQATAAAQAPYRMAEIGAQTGASLKETQMRLEAEKARLAQTSQGARLVVPAPAPANQPTSAAGADRVSSPLQITLDAAKKPPNPNQPLKLF